MTDDDVDHVGAAHVELAVALALVRRGAPREWAPPAGGWRQGSGPAQWPVSSGGRLRALRP